MGHALEVIAGQATAPGGTPTPITMNTGNSATVRFADINSKVALIAAWAKTQAAGVMRIRSPKLHDNVQGLRYRIPTGDVAPVIQPGLWQRLVPQDTLTLEIQGSAVGGQFEQMALLNYYSDLPGNMARLISVAELMNRTVNMWTTEVAVTPGVAGGYSGAVAINSTFDNFKANTDYALVGYHVDTLCTVVRITGPDVSNLGIGGPGLLSARWLTERWFTWLSEELNLPMIPVINSANKFGTVVDVMQDQAGAAVKVVLYLHELTGAGGNQQAAQPQLT